MTPRARSRGGSRAPSRSFDTPIEHPSVRHPRLPFPADEGTGKLKFNFKGDDLWTQPFITLLQGRTNEIILRDPEQLQYIADAANEALQIEGHNAEQLEQLIKIIKKKSAGGETANGTKAQLKPSFNEAGECTKVVVVVKWGGEFTHAARYQARDIGENMRKGTSSPLTT